MSTRVTRAEAPRRMAALQEPLPGQGCSETRPTRAPRRALERTRDEDFAPEPAVSSDSDVEVVGDPAVEEREWRLRKAAAGGRIPRGTTDIGGATRRRYAAEEPSPRNEDEDEPRAPSPPRWLPEVPPTPRYEGEWLTDGARDGDGGAPLATPPWRPVRPPTPRYVEPQRPEEHTPSEEATAQPMPQPQEEEVHQAQAEEPSVVRTEVPAAHVSHSTRAFVAEGVRWRQQTLVWTWPEGPAAGPTKEEPRIWEEGGPPTPATAATTGEAESLEKGPWVWPEPPATQRPPLQRQVSTPGSTRPRPQFMRQVSAPEEGGWREVARSEWPEGIEDAPAVATARRKGGRRCVLVNGGRRRYRVRLGVAGIRVFTQ
ncbi:predicted GPI-anchored protein 58 [Drosophila subpulchrella]|uniref:predicted GPI-anchored protein 58 n=1 Tax=Drosophila subpulchrella TaxID=1486046 RepID=UPI0018A150A3|nr:predicted GPI-anchored protein 58 [Drosophila subpulchrella]